MKPLHNENLVKCLVSYTLEFEGKLYIIKNVPARVNKETGEQFFSPLTVEHLQKTILGDVKPHKVIKTPVYEYNEIGLA